MKYAKRGYLPAVRTTRRFANIGPLSRIIRPCVDPLRLRGIRTFSYYMIPSLALALLVTISGTVATYLYDDNASFPARLCSGACLGLAGFGLVGFVVASFVGLTSASILLSALICAVPLAILVKPAYKRCLEDDLGTVAIAVRRFVRGPSLSSLGYFIFYLLVTIVLWRVFARAMIQDTEGISTGLLNNFGDLPFHLSIITSFAHGNNFPPEDPTYSGIRFTYPFLSDFVSAVFVQCGADLRQSLFIENFLLGLAFVGLMHRWALVMLRDRIAAVVTPLLVLLNGGLGWTLLITNANKSEQGLWGILSDLPPSFTVIPETTWRWGNAISALLVPQRGFLMGLPLAVIVFTQWWLASDAKRSQGDAAETESATYKTRKQEKRRHQSNATRTYRLNGNPARRMVAAGVAAGLLPLVHAHSFVVVMAMGACLALMQMLWREWFIFFATASVIAIPQLLWSTSHSAVNAGSFFAWEFGWDHGLENPIWFWFKNTGIFIPLVLTSILIRGRHYLVNKRVLMFYLPFVLCFIVPNFLKMAPWIWDNIKVLFYWWLASAPLVALLLTRLWRQGGVMRILALFLFVCVTLSGALDVAGIALRSTKYGIFDNTGIRFAELIKQDTAPRSLIVHAPVHNDPVFLSGRRSLMGYPGHIWTHGLEFVQRESQIKRIYAGAPDAEQLIRNFDVDYIVVGPLERLVMPVNNQFFARYKKVGEVGEYTLYKVKP